MLNILYDKPGCCCCFFLKATVVMQNVYCGGCFSSVTVRKGSCDDGVCSGPPFIHRMCTRGNKISELTKSDLDPCGENNQALWQV